MNLLRDLWITLIYYKLFRSLESLHRINPPRHLLPRLMSGELKVNELESILLQTE